MTMDADRRYSSEEVGNIVRHGLRAKTNETVDHQELMEIAREQGLDEADVRAALEKLDQEQRQELRVRKNWAGFTGHLYSYLGVIAFLFLVDIFTPGPWWFQWPALGWGLGLFFHYRGVLRTANRLRAADRVS